MKKIKVLYNLVRLFKHINRRRKVQLFLLLILTIFSSVAEVVSIGAIFPFLAIITNQNKIYNNKIIAHFFNIEDHAISLSIITFIFIFIILLSSLIRLLLLWAQTKLSYGIGAEVSYKIYRNTLYQPYDTHINRNSSEVISGISTKSSSIIHVALLPILNIFNSLAISIMIVALLFLIDPVISFITFFGFGSIYFLIILFTRKKLDQEGAIGNIELNNVIKILSEGLGGIRDVLIDGSQEIYCQIYKKSDTSLRNSQAKLSIIGSSPRPIIEGLALILIITLAFFITQDKNGVNKAIPLLGGLALGAQRLLPVLQQAYTSVISLLGGQSILNDTLNLLEQELPEYFFNDVKKINFNNKIQVKNLYFKYHSNQEWILKDVNLTISSGCRVGFVGETGSGKSTLLDILMGLLIPTKGDILIDEININSTNFRSWQLNISHVPQNIFLADTSIAENIAFGTPEKFIDYKKVEQVAIKAQLNNTIDLLKEGYYTKVGEKGVKLSGGQRQRIGIARALYKRPEIIIFDEATNALDQNSENEILDTIRILKKENTIIIVSHKDSVLRYCDKIFELKNK